MKKAPQPSRSRKGSTPSGASMPSQGQAAGTESRSDAPVDRQRQIQDLIDLLKRNNLTELEWECANYRVRVRNDLEVKPVAANSAETGRPAQPAAMEPAAIKESMDAAGLVTITSPIVGTFYRSPAPDADAYIEEGDVVKKGQVLCIVEAMKLMNEIESEVDGRVVKILVESSKPVEYGQPLFLIEPS